VLRPAPIAVETARAERGLLQETVDAEGKTQVRDRFVVAADVDGRIDYLEDGKSTKGKEVEAFQL
jgi:HlyD family secretion protein